MRPARRPTPRGVVEALGQIGIQSVLAGVAARSVPAVVAEGDGLGQGHVEPARPGHRRRHLGHLEGVGQPGPLVVGGVDEDLGLAGQAAERGGVQDAVTMSTANRSPMPPYRIWQTGADGLYDIQESATQVDYRGIFTTDAEGVYVLRTVKPVGYSIPMDGPVGGMVKAQARHGMRPAHIHFLVGAPGYRELVTALYLRDDPHLADDVVFGSSGDLAVDLDANDPGCPIKGLPSIRFDLRLSREGAADKTSGRVGADPATIVKQPALT